MHSSTKLRRLRDASKGTAAQRIFENRVRTCYVVFMAIAPISELLPQNRRRSKRFRARIPVCVRFQDANKHSVAENSHTIIVNEHGALILLATPVKVQQIIRLENLTMGKELLCRVALIGPTFMGKTQIAVEFIMPMPGFWNAGPTLKGAEAVAIKKK
jgi:hypothetical protein